MLQVGESLSLADLLVAHALLTFYFVVSCDSIWMKQERFCSSSAVGELCLFICCEPFHQQWSRCKGKLVTALFLVCPVFLTRSTSEAEQRLWGSAVGRELCFFWLVAFVHSTT